MTDPRRRVVLAITGASGAAYAVRLLQLLVDAEIETHLVITPYGQRLLADELDIQRPTVEGLLGRASSRVIAHSYHDVGGAIASGSFLTRGMVICPCSSNTLAAIASGLGDNLITRAAHVHLKERRRLVLVTRESPLSTIEIGNMLRLSEAGAIICPASPGFYLRPRTLAEIVDFMCGKVLDLLEIEHALRTRWQGGLPDAPPRPL